MDRTAVTNTAFIKSRDVPLTEAKDATEGKGPNYRAGSHFFGRQMQETEAGNRPGRAPRYETFCPKGERVSSGVLVNFWSTSLVVRPKRSSDPHGPEDGRSDGAHRHEPQYGHEQRSDSTGSP